MAHKTFRATTTIENSMGDAIPQDIDVFYCSVSNLCQIKTETDSIWMDLSDVHKLASIFSDIAQRRCQSIEDSNQYIITDAS